MDSAIVSPGDRGARERLSECLGYTFRDERLLETALSHPSLARELGTDPLLSNERLEFLGDAVIELAISAYLYEHLPSHDEGGLTTTRSFIVRGATLAQAAAAMGLGRAVVMSRSADRSRGRSRDSVLASTLEAVLGAVFVDGGWQVARDCALRVLEPQIADAMAQRRRNYKGELQELTQDRFRAGPEYRVLEVSGPAHERSFSVEVLLCERLLAAGFGNSKKEAEQAAAAAALAVLEAELATSG
ncbi:MAG: ribonuclease III [Armatimonadetes bacterium]|nr:ribonuclease III [Armatimonadota bacterium]